MSRFQIAFPFDQFVAPWSVLSGDHEERSRKKNAIDKKVQAGSS